MSKLSHPLMQALLAHELALGNAVAAEETGWSNMDLVVRMKKPLDSGFAERAVSESGGAVRSFHTNDPHNHGAEYGVVCGRESIVSRI